MPKSNALVNRNDYDTKNELILKGKEIYDKNCCWKKEMKQTLWTMKLNMIN